MIYLRRDPSIHRDSIIRNHVSGGWMVYLCPQPTAPAERPLGNHQLFCRMVEFRKFLPSGEPVGIPGPLLVKDRDLRSGVYSSPLASPLLSTHAKISQS